MGPLRRPPIPCQLRGPGCRGTSGPGSCTAGLLTPHCTFIRSIARLFLVREVGAQQQQAGGQEVMRRAHRRQYCERLGWLATVTYHKRTSTALARLNKFGRHHQMQPTGSPTHTPGAHPNSPRSWPPVGHASPSLSTASKMLRVGPAMPCARYAREIGTWVGTTWRHSASATGRPATRLTRSRRGLLVIRMGPVHTR